MNRAKRMPRQLGVIGLLWAMFRGHTVFFLKCDAKGCNHQEYYPYPHFQHINRPCPQCGNNLCTAEDMEAFIVGGLNETDQPSGS